MGWMRLILIGSGRANFKFYLALCWFWLVLYTFKNFAHRLSSIQLLLKTVFTNLFCLADDFFKSHSFIVRQFFLVVHCWCAIYRIEWKFFHIIRQKWSFNFQFGKYNCCCCFFPVCILIYAFHSYQSPFDYWLFFSLSRILSTVCIVQQRFCFEWKIKKNQQPKVEYGRKNLYAK